MSSYLFLGTKAVNFYINSSGYIYNDYVDGIDGIRPVISLKSTVELTGNGTMESPFEVVS